MKVTKEDYILIRLYNNQDVNIGSLPYTLAFDEIYHKFMDELGLGAGWNKALVWHRLHNLSRGKHLQKKTKKDVEEQKIKKSMGKGFGLSKTKES